MAAHHPATVNPEQLPWLPLAPKIGVKVLRVDRETGRFSVMIRAEAGGVLPRHRHIESAEILVLKGKGTHKQTGYFEAGNYISEAKGALHDALHFDEEVELLMVCDGPSAFLADDGSVQHVMDIGMLDYLAASNAASPA